MTQPSKVQMPVKGVQGEMLELPIYQCIKCKGYLFCLTGMYKGVGPMVEPRDIKLCIIRKTLFVLYLGHFFPMTWQVFIKPSSSSFSIFLVR